jgi:hypothetical protein
MGETVDESGVQPDAKAAERAAALDELRNLGEQRLAEHEQDVQNAVVDQRREIMGGPDQVDEVPVDQVDRVGAAQQRLAELQAAHPTPDGETPPSEVLAAEEALEQAYDDEERV